MTVTDLMVMYKRSKNEYDKRGMIHKIRLDPFLMKEVLEEFQSILCIIDAKYYSILLEAVSEHSISATVVEDSLSILIEKIPFYHLKSLIETLQRYYTSIELSKYRELCETRLSIFCKMSATAEDFKLEMNCDCLKETHEVGVFNHSLEHYMVNDIIIPRLKHATFDVSFKGDNEIFQDMILAFVTTLQLDAREAGVSDEVIYLGEGSYSIVLQIGNQVLKLGKSRRNNVIPSSPELVQWRFRRYFEESGLFIEVQPLLDMKDITQEEVLELAISSYQNNHYWSDVFQNEEIRIDNVGRLLDDNFVKDGKLNSLARYIMGRNQESEPVYKTGSCVISDTDYFENLNDTNKEKANDEYEKSLLLLGKRESSNEFVNNESSPKVKRFY